MVKSYLKFEHTKTFGQVCSASSNAIWIDDEAPTPGSGSTVAGRAVVGASEDVLVWDIKKGELLSRWVANENRAQVTAIARSRTDPDVFAVGYEDGKIRVWDLKTATIVLSFNGHRSAITCLVFDDSGVRLASGSKDTDIILWDLVGETGLFKLRGHKDQITSLNFLRTPRTSDSGTNGLTNGDHDYVATASSLEETGGYLLSTGKDALLKVWDLTSQYCIETKVAQNNGECWALGLSPDQAGCVTAGNDGELRAWTVNGWALLRKKIEGSLKTSSEVLSDRGSFYRRGRDRTTGIHFHPRRDYVAFYGSEKSLEIWRIRSEDEIRKTLARKRKRRREKAAEGKENQPMEVDDEKTPDVSTALVTEVFVPYLVVRTGGKVRSMDWAGGKSGKAIWLQVATSNNQVEIYKVSVIDKKRSKDEQPDYNRDLSVDMPGHRSDIRCLALSSDDRMLASASHGSLKIWNTRTQSCIRTLDCGVALCATFLPGDKIVVLGTKEGTIEVFDIASSTLLDTIEAHERDIWSLQVHPDGKSLVTGSADKSAKFWEFRVVQEEILGTNRKTPRLTLVHNRTLKVTDDILSVRFSPDARLLAVSTLDSTVKVFFVDTLKLFLTLYGHKLPVLGMDISYDSKLIVTCSADKNIRVWGLDFGDCHKALFVHQNSILSVAFVPTNDDGNGHHFFSASKDQLIKYFDGDKFEQIQKLPGHHGEIWAMAVAHSGSFLITASHDKSIRVWSQTDEQIFLEEEREKELEALYEDTLLTSLEADNADDAGTDQPDALVSAAAGKQTTDTLMAGEKIAEALTLGDEDLALVENHITTLETNLSAAPPPRHPVFLHSSSSGPLSAQQYVRQVFARIPPAQLEDALLVLSFTQVPILLRFLALWAEEGGMGGIGLVVRVLLFVLRVHQRQIVVSGGELREGLERVGRSVRAMLGREKRIVGVNLAGVKVLGRRVEGLGMGSEFVDGEDALGEESVGKGRKRAFVNVA